MEQNQGMLVMNSIAAEGLSRFFEVLGKGSAKAGDKLATNVWKNPGVALRIGSKVGSAE